MNMLQVDFSQILEIFQNNKSKQDAPELNLKYQRTV